MFQSQEQKNIQGEDFMVLSEIIKKARKDRRLSLREVAHLTKISLTLLCAIETGKQPRPKMDILYRLAAFYNLSSDKVCLSATRIPQDVFYKIIRCPELLEVVRRHKEG